MKFKANFVEKPGNFQMDDCRIEKAVELSHEDFCRLKITPLADQPFLAENRGCMFHTDGVIHCLLALGQGSETGCSLTRRGITIPVLRPTFPECRTSSTPRWIVRRTLSSGGGRRTPPVEAGVSISKIWRSIWI